jgi:hypothetical protein
MCGGAWVSREMGWTVMYVSGVRDEAAGRSHQRRGAGAVESGRLSRCVFQCNGGEAWAGELLDTGGWVCGLWLRAGGGIVPQGCLHHVLYGTPSADRACLNQIIRCHRHNREG